MINYSNSKRLTDRFSLRILSPKIISLRKIERLNLLSKSLVSSQKTSDGRYYQFFFSFHFCFESFFSVGKEAGCNYLMPQKLYSNLSFTQAFYVLTYFIEIEVSAEIMRKSLIAELRHGKLS